MVFYLYHLIKNRLADKVEDEIVINTIIFRSKVALRHMQEFEILMPEVVIAKKKVIAAG